MGEASANNYRKEDSSFLKKRSKRLLFSAAPDDPAMAWIYPRAPKQKSFGSFLQKRTSFLP
jgi:hypothetical protein